MTKQELEQKVINATTAVEKRCETLKKHREQLAKKIAKGADRWEILTKKNDIEGAEQKLKEAKKTLEGWQAKLGERISRDAFIEANAPQAVRDFLEIWKTSAIEYYRASRLDFIKLRAELRQAELAARLEALETLPEYERARERFAGREPSDSDLFNLWPREPVEEFLEARRLSRKEIRKTLAECRDNVTDKLLSIDSEAERVEWLEKTMEEEKSAKLVGLIARINKVVGTITDASNLSIGEKGDINGIVVGTEGKARIETIGVAGYNIVRFHYRTMIHELKGA